MNAVVEVFEGGLPDVGPEFFAPSNFDAVDTLLGQYQQQRQHVEAVDAFMKGKDMLAAVGYYFAGSEKVFNRYTPSVKEVFQVEAALAALNSCYWQRALSLTDVLDFMPDARRQEWYRSIQEHKTPEFEEQTVRATLESLLAQRMDFFAEMVDGIFRGLSGEHVTNAPEGFNRRMIIQGALSMYGLGRQAGLIHDLRCVVARFMGRGQPRYNINSQLLEHCRRSYGEWHSIDGGAFRLRVYKNGNAHLEVHPDMAWRLNQILAHRYPTAIPARFRMRPAKRRRDYVLMERPIPFAVLSYIGDGRFHRQGGRFAEHTFVPGHSTLKEDKHVTQEANRVLAALGGTLSSNGHVEFSYDASDVISEVLTSGALPDHVSHQYYPTPAKLARELVEMAEIDAAHRCLEPSAGQGALADYLPAEQTLCVEISPLNCKVLESKGYDTICDDFLDFDDGRRFDRIVMNPPFSQGRAAAHVQHASKLLAPGGRLVAILPSGFAGKDVLPGIECQWSRIYDNEFVGTSVSVVILRADKPATA